MAAALTTIDLKDPAHKWLSRWMPLIPHPKQIALISDPHRFKVVPAGRRSGKTERAKRKLIQEAISKPHQMLFCCAPTRPQVKKIYWEDLKKMSPPHLTHQKMESDLIIKFKNGSQIHLLGMEKPERIEGIAWDGGVCDEFADMKEVAWRNHIRPSLDTMGKEAWCWLIGVPDGLNHYYDLFVYATESGDPDWKAYTWMSEEILPAAKILAAKRELDPRSYRQEYQAAFENATGRVYDDYGRDNWTDIQLNPNLPIAWAHDFNFTPMSSCILQLPQPKKIVAVGEIVLRSAVAQNAALEFVERYKDHKIKKCTLYGDASGNKGEKHSIVSDYMALEDTLRKAGWTVERRVPRDNPAIKDSQNSLRKLIRNAAGEVSFFVNRQACPTLHKGLNVTSLKEGSAFQEEEADTQHITTAARYFAYREFPAVGKAVGGNI